MVKKRHWNWTSFFIGAASATAASALVVARPKDPTFNLVSVDLTSFKLNFPVVEAELLLTVHARNPNITPAHYSSTTMSIFYDGSLLGSADISAGSQPPNSCQVLRFPARLGGTELASRAGRFFADVAKREMVLDASVDVSGTARLLWWSHRFKVHVDGRATVDPILLDVIDQEIRSEMQISYLG